MNKLIFLVPLVFLIGCFGNDEPKPIEPIEIEIIDENLAPNDGCCEISGGSCASGGGVKKEYCETELHGTHSVGKVCNIENGKCE